MKELAYIKVFLDWKEKTARLKDAEKGRLIDALIDYANGKQIEDGSLPGNEAILFPAFQLQIDRDRKDLAELCEVRRESGRKGGRPRKADASSENQKNQMVFSETKKSKEEDYRLKNKEKDSSLAISNEIACPPGDAVGRVVEAWNGLKSVKPVQRLQSGTQREAMLKARIREYGLESVMNAVNIIPQCPFLMGDNRNGWAITFDWFVKPNNFPKVLEGNYLPAEQKSSNPFKNLSVEDW